MKAKARPRGPQRKAKVQSKSRQDSKNDFLIAAIGASAGGIEAFTELITALPPDTGMAFVLIQHLDPKHHSLLADLLSKKTSMQVEQVTDGMHAEVNHVYVIPPNASMSISDHTLHLGPREESRGLHMPIDHFMRALAQEQRNRAIGVILSGSGTDGTLGMAEIQAHGGVTFAQDVASAKSDGMPRSAAAAGCVDYVLPPTAIARELARIARHPYVARELVSEAQEFLPAEKTGLSAIFQLLRRSAGVDFTHYRQTTVLRRIQRRRVVHKIDKLADYLQYIHTNPPEINALYQDMLINVTNFFRNPRVFDSLQSQVFPNILKHRPPETSIRVWTPGCASGEETYSVAIALLEFLSDKAPNIPIQLFGTDISEASITKARSRFYPDNIQGDVSAERLSRFFTKVDGGYRISKNIRDMCIFAQHNLLNDPPFSQMDLVSCRNLLIYLEPVLQSKVISLFHYATRPAGYLVLGTSEGIGSGANLFATEDRIHKIYLRKTTAGRQLVTFPLAHPGERYEYGSLRIPAKLPDSGWNYMEAQKEFDRRLLSQYAPATVFINEDLEIIHTRGSVNRYLKLAPGRASLSILKMAREGILFDLRDAISRAKQESLPIRKQSVQIKSENGDGGEPHSDPVRFVNFEVAPFNIGDLKELYFMIIFQDAPPEIPRVPAARRTLPERESVAASGRIAKLEQELAATKQHLQSVIEPRKPPMKSFTPPTKRFFPATRNSRAPTRNLKPPRKSYSLLTRNSPPSTMSCAIATSRSPRSTPI